MNINHKKLKTLLEDNTECTIMFRRVEAGTAGHIEEVLEIRGRDLDEVHKHFNQARDELKFPKTRV